MTDMLDTPPHVRVLATRGRFVLGVQRIDPPPGDLFIRGVPYADLIVVLDGHRQLAAWLRLPAAAAAPWAPDQTRGTVADGWAWMVRFDAGLRRIAIAAGVIGLEQRLREQQSWLGEA